MNNSIPVCDDLQSSDCGADAELGGVARRVRPGEALGAAGGGPHGVTRGQLLQNDAAIVDWLAFSVPAGDGETVEQCADWLLGKFPDGATLLERGSMGYTHGWRLPAGGLLLYNPQRPDMKVHCELPSRLLALLDVSPASVIAMVLAEGGVFTRLDVAIDSDSVTIGQVDEAVRAGDLVSRSNTRRFMGDYDGDGFTIYIGAGSSRRLVRFYDKAAEQKLTGGEVWTRCEVQFRSDQAQAAALHLVGGVDARSLVLSAVDFRDASTDDNISRCPQLDWWASWVGHVGRVSFALGAALTKTVEEVYEWVRRQVAPSLAFLDQFFGNHPTWLYELCDANKHRIPAERQMMLLAG